MSAVSTAPRAVLRALLALLVAATPRTARRALVIALAVATPAVLAPGAANAASLRTFSNTYAQTLHGDIAAIGNANTTCNPSWTPTGACDPSTQNYNNSSRGYGGVNNVDGTQSNSSSSTVSIPAGSTIQYARLTWGTTGDNTDGNGEQTVKFRAPGASTYSTVTDADGCDGLSAANANRGVGCSADVTSIVQGAGQGTYTVANIEQRQTTNQSANGTGTDTVDDWSGWALYIVFSNPNQPLRRIVLSDGFQVVSTSAGSATVALNGFTAPATGTVSAHLDYAVGEGDVGITGDNATLNTTKLDTRATPDLMNSTIAGLDYATSRNPNFLNNYGFDFHNSDITGAIANGDTSANFTFTTTGDTYYPFSTGITIDLAEPNVVLTKTLNDVNGGVVEAGDVIEYQIVAQNQGNDGAANVVLTDAIPAHSTYVPGSLQVTAGANAGAMTDAAGDDQADYNAGTNAVTFRVGTGATSSQGGVLPANTGTTTVKFRVTLDPNLGDGVTVSNTANGSYVGQTSLSSYANPSTIAATPARRADMVVTQNTGTLTAGKQGTITLTATNSGGATTHGNPVTVTTSVPANVTFGSITSSTGWTCDTSSLPTITCTRSDVLNGGDSYPVISYTVTPSQTQPSASFSASIAGGNEIDTSNDTDTRTATFVRSADLSLTNVADRSSANVGDTITYSIAGHNAGPSTTTGVATTATLPSTLQPVSATLGGSPCTISGQTITCTTGALDVSGAAADTAAIVVKAKVLPAAGGTTVTVDPSIAGSDPDPDTTNNHAAAAVTINAAGDVQVTETVSPSTVNPGSNATFTFTVKNNGPSTSTGIVFSDTLPSGATFVSATPSQGSACTGSATISCALGSLASGASATVTVILKPTTASAGTSVANPGSVSATTFDYDTSNNASTASVTVNPAADLRTTVGANASTSHAGDTVDYTVTVHNDGPSSSAGATATITLPASATIVSVTPSVGTCDTASPRVCSFGTLANGAAPTVVVRVTMTGANAGSNATLSATASETTFDPQASNDSDSASVPVTGSADLKLTETSSPATLNPGSNATFTYTVKNNGPNTATGIVFTDPLPSGVTLVSATPSQGSACTGTSTVSCAIGTLANGASATVTVVVTAGLSTAGTTVSNPGSVTETDYDPNTADNSSTASVTVNPAADLRTTVTATPTTSHVGDTVDYLVTVNNDGPSPAAGSTVALDLPDGATIVSVTPSSGVTCPATGDPRTCTLGTLASGAAPTIAVRVTLTNANANANATLAASAATTTFDPATGNNSASASSAVDAAADLKLTETVSPTSVNPGSNATYTFTVKNNGPNTSTGISLSDTLPAGVTVVSITPSQGTCGTGATFTCALGSLANGNSATVAVVVTPALSTAGTSLSNPGSVTATTFDPSTTDNSASASLTVKPAADLRTTVTATPTTASVGDTVDYLVTVHNDGPSSAAGATVAVDLPDGATIVSVTPSSGVTCPSTGDPRTCTLGTLANGAAPMIAVKVTLTGANAGANATLAATAAATTYDPTSGNDSASASSAVAAAADLKLTETVSPSSVNPGSNATYTFTVKNNGPGTAAGVSLTDTLPSGVTVVSRTPSQGTCGTGSPFTCALGSLASGASATVAVVVTPALSTAGTSLANPGSVTTTSYDPNTADNSATASLAINDAADLRTTVTGTPASAAVGDTVDYLVTVHNDGPSSAAGATVALDLPDGATIISVTPSSGVTCPATGDPRTCTLGTLSNGAAPTIAVKVKLTTANAASNVTLAANASATTFDPTAGNNADSASIAAGTTADLQLTATSSPATVDANQNTTYTFTVKNNGPNDAGSVTFTDDLPAGVTVVSITPSQGSCGTGDPFSCNLGTVTNGSSATVTVVVKPGTSNAGGALADAGSVSAGTPDPDTSNNAASASVTVNDAADLRTTVTSTPTSGKVGDTIDYLVTVHNGGPQSATGATVDLNLPNGATVVSTTPSQGTCPSTGDPRTCTLGTLANGADATIAVKVTLAGANAGTNAGVAATASATTFDPTPANNADSAQVAVDQAADLRLTETVSPASANPGSDVTYTFTVTNDGPGTATGVDLTDTIPAGATLVSVTPPAGVTCGTGNPFHCAVGTLPSGGSATFTVVLRPSTSNAGSAMSNPVSASSTSYDPTPGNNADFASTQVNPTAELSAAASVDHTTAAVGDTLNYLLTVTNNGPSPATNGALLVHLPAGATILSVTPSAGTCDSASPRNCSLGSIGVGSSATVNVKLRVESANAGSTISVSGDASATEFDQNPSNNTAVATSSAGDAADLAITKTSDHPTANVGDTVTWTLTARNNGPQTALGTTVGDAIPAGVTITSATSTVGSCTVGSAITCSVGSLANGASAVITIKGTVNRSAADSPLSSQASVTGSVFDPDTSNNVSTTTTTVGSAADLRLVKVIDNPNPRIGDHVTWTLQVFNDGPSAATNVHLVDVVPAGAPIDSVTATAGTCTRSGQSVDCVIPSIAGGSSAVVTIKATVSSGAGGASLNNSATVTSSILDPDTSNNTSTANSTAGGAADLSVTLTPDRTSVTVGQPITWNGVVANNGPQTATGTTVTLNLPDGLTDVSASTPGGTCTISGRTVTCTVADVPVGGIQKLTIVGTPTRTTAGADLTMGAVVASNQSDPSPADNTTSSGVVAVAPAVNLTLTKTADKTTATVDEPLTITSTVRNQGPSTATDVVVTDVLPDGVELQSVSPSQGTCQVIGQTITCHLGQLADGQSATIATVVVVRSAGLGQRLLSGGTVSSAEFDLDPTDNAAESSTVAIAPSAAPAAAPFIDFSKTVDKAAPVAG
ncbi:MAG: CARDB domain-containing protein, partial [Patulibacter sp.]|nr:CARDB domain-containing protein [Patulibacter sp.]